MFVFFFYENFLYNGFIWIVSMWWFLCELFSLKLLLVWKGVFWDSQVCFFNIWNGDEQKNCTRNFKICKYAFLIFEKSDEQKNCVRNFQIRKYAFFNIWKGDEQKIAPGILRFVSMLFLNIWKGEEQKNCPRNFEIRKYAFFNIREKRWAKKLRQKF